MFPSVLSNGRVNDDSTATFVSKLKVTVENGQTAEFDSHGNKALKHICTKTSFLITKVTKR